MIQTLHKVASLVAIGYCLVTNTPTAHAQTIIDTLKTFNGTNGSNPYGSLISDGTYLYGTTYAGGVNSDGNLFKIKPDGTGYVDLFDFNGANGSSPEGSLVSDGTWLYGMASNGGQGNGLVFKIKPDGTGFKTLISFNGTNGSSPSGSLLFINDTLYGMTASGGAMSYGNVFKIDTSGATFVDLFDFNNTNGNNPGGSLIYDGMYLYGTTGNGGIYGLGNIFKLKTDGTGFDTLTSFNSTGTYGWGPYGSLLLINDTLYGTNENGGIYNLGTVFKLKTDGTGLNTLISFNGTNGSDPSGSLIYDGTYLYGTSASGGANANGNVFKIKINGTGFVDMADFTNTGANPHGDLLLQGGFLYGTASAGGTNNDGVVFKLCTNPPTVSVTSVTIAPGNTATLTASGTATSYTWSTGETTAAIMVSPMVSTVYTVTGSNSICSARGVLDTVGVVQLGAALNFDGVNDNITVNTGTTSLTAPYTVDAWVNPNAATYGYFMTIFSTTGSGTDDFFETLLSTGVSGIRGNIGTGSGWLSTLAGGASPFVPGQWLHIAYVVTTTGFTVYANGVQIGSGSLSGTAVLYNASHHLNIGNQRGSSSIFFNGSMDEVRVWGVARTQCQINNSMNCELPPSDRNGLVVYYKFNEGTTFVNNVTVNTAVDSSGNGYNGTLANFALNGITSNWTAPGAVTTGFSCAPNNNPVITVAIPGTICAGTTTTLTASGAATSYTWSTGATTTSITTTPTITTTYTVSNTIAGCATGITIDTVQVDIPNITVNSGAICTGSSFTITPIGAVTYTYSSGAAVVSPTSNASYSVTGTDGNGCISAAAAISTVTVNMLPTLTVNSGSVCAGSSFTITPSGASTYTYSSGSAVVTPTSNVSYTVTGTSAAGCAATNTVTASVTVNALPTVTTNSATVCAGATVTLTASGTATSYTWSTAAATVSISVAPNTPTNYTVMGMDANSCVGTATTSVDVNALPTISVSTTTVTLCKGSTATITASGANTYTWNLGATTPAIAVSPTVTTTYTVMGTSAGGCENMITVTQSVTTCGAGVEQYNSNSNEVTVYPNPNNGNFVVTTAENTTTIVVTDVLGNELVSVNPNGSTTTNINLSAQPSGMYFIKVTASGTQIVKRIIINN